MAFHDRMRAMVIRQLAAQPKGKGVPITFVKRISGGFDPSTGKTTPIVNKEFTSSGVRVNYSDYAFTNTQITYGDFQIYLSPVLDDGTDTPEPSIGDHYTFLNRKVVVVNYSHFNENSVGCGWKLQVRYG